jgi:HTH-type transcriptional regulator / antitoxin HipB
MLVLSLCAMTAILRALHARVNSYRTQCTRFPRHNLAMSFGTLIKRARRERGWTQAELAERVGIDRSAVSMWERGKQVPANPAQFNAIVGALGLSAEDGLRALGYHIFPPAASRLPRDLIEVLLEMSPEQHRALLDFVRPLPPATNGSRR